MTIILQQGIGAFNIENDIGITPAQYLKENLYADISEKDIIQEYIATMMGECEWENVKKEKALSLSLFWIFFL